MTSVRDPIARIISQAFYVAEKHGEVHDVDIVRSGETLIDWWNNGPLSRMDLLGDWFEDTYSATFGFDYRVHPFCQKRKALRFDSDRLRLLVLRQEDPIVGKEVELGWLLDRGQVTLPVVNSSISQRYEAAYRPFLASFMAPSIWLEAYYDTDAMTHFYTMANGTASGRNGVVKAPILF